MIHLSLSGGLDSTVLAAIAATRDPDDVRTYTFTYGQRHRDREVRAARDVAEHLNLHNQTVVLPQLRSEALTGTSPVPDGHYTDTSMSATVVQGRNLLFIATLIAFTSPGDEVWIGVHSGDHAIYPDCRQTFVIPLSSAVANAYDIVLRAPFIADSKADIASKGWTIDAPMHLSWSCYKGQDIHCGRCGTCVERAEAFADAGVPDPTTYADPDYWRTAVDRFRQGV